MQTYAVYVTLTFASVRAPTLDHAHAIIEVKCKGIGADRVIFHSYVRCTLCGLRSDGVDHGVDQLCARCRAESF